MFLALLCTVLCSSPAWINFSHMTFSCYDKITIQNNILYSSYTVWPKKQERKWILLLDNYCSASLWSKKRSAELKLPEWSFIDVYFINAFLPPRWHSPDINPIWESLGFTREYFVITVSNHTYKILVKWMKHRMETNLLTLQKLIKTTSEQIQYVLNTECSLVFG